MNLLLTLFLCVVLLLFASRVFVLNMAVAFEDMYVQFSMEKILADYPTHCLPNRLNKRTGKARKCLFDELDINLYDTEAKMVAFHTSVERIHYWIKALEL